MYTEFLNIAKIWPNLAPVLRIWHKKYLSGESGGERKKYSSANPVCNHVKIYVDRNLVLCNHVKIYLDRSQVLCKPPKNVIYMD